MHSDVSTKVKKHFTKHLSFSYSLRLARLIDCANADPQQEVLNNRGHGLAPCTYEATGRRDRGRMEPRWFSIRHTESIQIDYSQLQYAVADPESLGENNACRTFPLMSPRPPSPNGLKVCHFQRASIDQRAIVIAIVIVCLSVCHSCDPHFHASRYRNILHHTIEGCLQFPGAKFGCHGFMRSPLK